MSTTTEPQVTTTTPTTTQPAASSQAAPTPAAGGTSPAAGATSAGAAPGTANPASAEWYAGFSDESLRGFVANKQFKDPAMMAESYRNLEKLRGVPEDQLLKISADPAEQKAMWQKLGTPDKPEGYGLDTAADAPQSQKDFTDWAKATALKANMTTEQFKSFVGEWNTRAQTEAKNKTEAQLATAKQEFDGLKAEWGNAYDQKTNVATAAAKEFGLTVEQIDGIQKTLGYSKTMKLLSDIGSKLGEGTFTQGSQPPANLSVDAAKAQIALKKSDPAYMAKYATKDQLVYAEFSKLLADAYPGTTSVG